MKNGLYERDEVLKAEVDDAKRMLQHNIGFDWRWAAEALVTLTAREVFIDYDTGILTSIAVNVVAWQAKEEKDRKYPIPFSLKQFQVLQNRLPKYTGQLLKAMKEVPK